MAVVLFEHERAVLRAISRAEAHALPLEEIAPTARISFEEAWYAALDLIQLQLLTPDGIGFYRLTAEGTKIGGRL